MSEERTTLVDELARPSSFLTALAQRGRSAFLACLLLFMVFSAYADILKVSSSSAVAAIVPTRKQFAVFVTHKRTGYLERCLRSFISQAHFDEFDVIVSLDHHDSEVNVRQLISTLSKDYSLDLNRLQLMLKPSESSYTFAFQAFKEQAVDRHIMFALKTAFSIDSYDYGILIEEDLELAPDFLDLMISGMPMLAKDPTLFCITGWNDNGFKTSVTDPYRLMRTDTLPGLGFMMKRETARGILGRWKGYDFWGWDQWMRRQVATDQRECIAPELPRVFHFGTGGVHVADNSSYESQAFSNKNDLGKFKDAFTKLDLQLYDADLKLQLEHAQFLSVDAAVADPTQFTLGTVYAILMEKKDCKSKKLGKMLGIFYGETCRMTHRGLIESKILIGNEFVKVFMIDRHTGAEWIPATLNHLKQRDPNLKPLFTEDGETCNTRCSRDGLICSSHDAAFVRTCDDLKPFYDCTDGCVVSHDHRGAAVTPKAQGIFSFGRPEAVCYESEKTGFFCHEETPKDKSVLCPCIAELSYFNFSFDYNQQ